MRIHFICRGNTFRSIIAEAYAKSLKMDGLLISSSGTVAKKYKKYNAKKYSIVVNELKKQGLDKFVKTNWGENTTNKILKSVDICVFMDEIVKQEAIDLGFEFGKSRTFQIPDYVDSPHLDTSKITFAEYVRQIYPKITREVNELVRNINT